jgi:hypothetical protein
VSIIADAVIALLFAWAAVRPFHGADELLFVLLVEGGFLLMQGTLIDIATRLKKRPPIWAVVIIAGGVLLFTGGHAHEVLRMAWERGIAVFVPLLFSLAQRARVLWLMPGRTRVQKIAARALVANRITTGLVLLALTVVAMIFTLGLDQPWIVYGAGAIYFAVAAFDAWRVRRARFAEKPSVLFRFDPIHIEYLEPL